MLLRLDTYYPLYQELSKQLVRSVIMGGTITWFLYCFQPFGINYLTLANKNMFLVGFGLITFLVFAFYFVLLPLIFPTHINDWDWSVGKQLVLGMTALLNASFFCYIYNQWYLELPYSLGSYSLFTLRACSIAVFPISFIVLMDKIYLLKNNFI